MKILIVGAGAVGQVYGYHLAQTQKVLASKEFVHGFGFIIEKWDQ